MMQLQSELRRLRKQQSDMRRRRDALTGLSRWTLETAVLICLLLSYDFSAGAYWLQMRRRRGTPLPHGLDASQVTALLEDVFLNSDECVLATWTDPVHSPLLQTVMRTATSFVRGYALAAWVRQRNAQGVVVPRTLLVERYSAPVGVVGHGMLIGAAMSASCSAACVRQWASRWRHRFGGKHMRLRVEDPVPLAEQRSKAR